MELVTSSLVCAGGYFSRRLHAGTIQHLGQEIKSGMFCSFNIILQLISPTTLFVEETLCLSHYFSVTLWSVVCRCSFCRIYFNCRGSYSLVINEIIPISEFYQHLTGFPDKYVWSDCYLISDHNLLIHLDFPWGIHAEFVIWCNSKWAFKVFIVKLS